MQENRLTATSPEAIYGYELVVNASGCSDPSVITKPKLIEFTTELCQAIDMKMALEPFFWDATDSDKPHVQGTSFVQFLETSSIVIHTLTITEIVFLNVFSCKEFNPAVVEQHVKRFFKPQHLNSQLIKRTYVATVRVKTKKFKHPKFKKIQTPKIQTPKNSNTQKIQKIQTPDV